LSMFIFLKLDNCWILSLAGMCYEIWILDYDLHRQEGKIFTDIGILAATAVEDVVVLPPSSLHIPRSWHLPVLLFQPGAPPLTVVWSGWPDLAAPNLWHGGFVRVKLESDMAAPLWTLGRSTFGDFFLSMLHTTLWLQRNCTNSTYMFL
jgi:hypothetical protein